jgi:hypothetical protein
MRLCQTLQSILFAYLFRPILDKPALGDDDNRIDNILFEPTESDINPNFCLA